MIDRAPDIDAISALLIEVGRDLILPRFRRLDPGDVERKHTATDPDDVVTVVDRQAEARLTESLLSLLPGTPVIGEEAVHARPEILEGLGSDGPVWLLDPIDGTRNFVAGDDGFGIMLAYVTGGEAQAAWILLPARDELFVAEAGSGAFFNGTPVKVAVKEPPPLLRGVLHVRYMPAGLKASITSTARGRFRVESDARSAAVEYMDILRGSRDFAVYYRLLPWDHAAPALILSEGGGRCEHLGGDPYRPRSPDQVTIVASSSRIADRVRGWFAPLTRFAAPDRAIY